MSVSLPSGLHVIDPCVEAGEHFEGCIYGGKPMVVDNLRKTLEEVIRANMLDGEHGGMVTMEADYMVTEVADIIADYLEEHTISHLLVDDA